MYHRAVGELKALCSSMKEGLNSQRQPIKQVSDSGQLVTWHQLYTCIWSSLNASGAVEPWSSSCLCRSAQCAGKKSCSVATGSCGITKIYFLHVVVPLLCAGDFSDSAEARGCVLPSQVPRLSPLHSGTWNFTSFQRHSCSS